MVRMWACFAGMMLLLSGCTSFDQRWKDMPAMAGAGTALPLAGKWEGKWQSAGGHNGDFRAIIVTNEAPSSATGTGSQHYAATFKSTYKVVLSATYTMDLAATHKPDGSTTFHGTKDLGALEGGLYEYEGQVVGDQFTATYHCPKDHGTFTMTRVTGAGR